MKDHTETKRVGRFLLVGLASTALYFLLLVLLRGLIPNTFLLAGVCYALSMAVNFVVQGMFTFNAPRLTSRAGLRYSIVQGGNLLTNSVAMGLLVDVARFPLIPSQIVVTGCLAGVTYIVSKRWVYV